MRHRIVVSTLGFLCLMVLGAIAAFGQVSATYIGSGNWSLGVNWDYSNPACSGYYEIGTGEGGYPGSFGPVPPCNVINVVIPKGSTVTQDVPTSVGFSSEIGNLTVNRGATLNTPNDVGAANVLNNQGTIDLSGADIGGATAINSGRIYGSGGLGAETSGANSGTIEATGTGSFFGINGALSLLGSWANSGGTLQVDNGGVLVLNGTVSGGTINVNGSGIVYGGTFNGTVQSDSLTLDNPGGQLDTSISVVNGTLANAGILTVAQAHAADLTVSSGANVVTDDTIIGANAGSNGTLAVDGQLRSGLMVVGQTGVGALDVFRGGTADVGTLSIGSGVGTGTLVVSTGGAVYYNTLDATKGSITIYANSSLTGFASGQSGDTVGQGVNVSVNGVWSANSGLTVKSDNFVVSSGGLVQGLFLSDLGNITVEDSGKVSSVIVGTNGFGAGPGSSPPITGLLTVDGGIVDGGLKLENGSVRVSNGGQLSGGPIDISGFSSTLTISDTGKLANVLAINIGGGGTMDLTNGASVAVGSRVSVSPLSNLNVLGGTLSIGSVPQGSSNFGPGSLIVGSGGTLAGLVLPGPNNFGNIQAEDLIVLGGRVSPGDPETFKISGNYLQTGGTLDLQVDGTGNPRR